LEAKLAALDADIAARVPRYAELRHPKPARLKQAQEWLAEDTVVLTYVLWDDSIDFIPIGGDTISDLSRPAINSYCLVISKEGLRAVPLDPDFDYIQAVNNIRSEMVFMQKTGIRMRTAQRNNRIPLMEEDRNALYNALIKPVLPHIGGQIQNLIIVPDGTLGHLPFDILRENEDSPDLGQTYRLTLSPSISVSMLSEQAAKQNLPILAFGGAWYHPERLSAEEGTRSVEYEIGTKKIYWPDLPGTEEEIKTLEQIVSPDQIRAIFGSEVNEAHIKQLSAEGSLAQYPIIHFAIHGYFKEDDLERAGLILSEVSGLIESDEDGYLTIPEIALLDLKARMVLLSACETGLGLLRRGDGMVGMVRAFLIAGAENMGVSLWEVQDTATLEFMGSMYSKVLNEGKTFREAYYATKDEFRNEWEWEHPYYWSGFVLYE
jgi:CHAT domain-containing protein